MEPQQTLPRVAALLRTNAARAVAAVLLLLLVAFVVAPVTVQPQAIIGVLPFAAILGIAALGQHIVIQQRGLDVSVAGTFSLAAVIVTAGQPASGGVPALLMVCSLALLAATVNGLANGLAVTVLRVPPLVSTLATSSIALGLTLFFSGGVPTAVGAELGKFSLGRTLWLPNTLIVTLVVAIVTMILIQRTVFGRKFVTTGLNATVANALGFPVALYRVGAYVVAALLFATAGIMFAGFSNVPTLFSGNEYMLASVASVIVGGNSIVGDRGSVLASLIGAFFLTYLGQLVITLGFDISVQFMIQAAIVLVRVGIPGLIARTRFA